MSADFRIALLVLGAVLLIAAVLAGQIFRRALGPRALTAARAALGVAGAAVIGWTIWWRSAPPHWRARMSDALT
jgi:hypothetical protein